MSGRARVIATAARDQFPRQRPDQQHDRHIDQEHRTPPEILQQQAADHRADGRAAGDHRGQMPIASARSRSSVKTWRTMDSVAGIIIAAPTARNNRAAISHSAVGENAAHSDATANTGSPARNSRLWPMRSLSMPAPGNRPATTNG